MSANSVSALAYRAREGLRQAYLQSHLAPTLHEGCRKTTGQLASYVRGGLSARHAKAVETHLDECSRCSGLYLELAEVNSNLSGILGPATLGGAAAGYLAGSGVTAAGFGAALGLKAAAGQLARLVIEPVKTAATGVAGAGAQGVVATAVVASLAVAGTVAVATDFGGASGPMVSAGPGGAPSPGEGAPTPSETPGLVELEPGLGTEVLPRPPPVELPVELPVEPAQPAEITPSDPRVEPHPEPVPVPATEVPAPRPPPAPTDYGIGSLSITSDDALLQHRYTVGISAATNGPATAREVTVKIAFRRSVVFRGVVSPGWSCGDAVRDSRLMTLTCTKTLPAGQGETFIAKARGLVQVGVISVSSPGDPNPGNDSRAFSAGLWLPL